MLKTNNFLIATGRERREVSEERKIVLGWSQDEGLSQRGESQNTKRALLGIQGLVSKSGASLKSSCTKWP